MKKILLATNNQSKVKEFKSILQDLNYEVYSSKDLGLEDLQVVEDGQTLEENALIKARAFQDQAGKDYMVLADDTGLFVDILDGQPGINSARFAGDHNDQVNREKLLDLMKDKEDRQARFETVIALVEDGAEDILVQGILNGEIAHKEAGDQGFGYDSIFIPKGYKSTLAQMSDQEKNSISHRKKAIEALVQHL